MSKIVVFGAGGKAGRLITEEAARRGHAVTAAARDLSNEPGFAEGVHAVMDNPAHRYLRRPETGLFLKR